MGVVEPKTKKPRQMPRLKWVKMATVTVTPTMQNAASQVMAK